MNSKIELYKEVLAFEPTSKVFFPLARLLWEAGELAQAATVLRSGLVSHPDHLEAKFMLIELCSQLGNDGEAKAAFGGLSDSLAKYPSFWKLWAKNPGALSQDSSVALSFLAAALGGADVAWTTVLQKGLQAVSEEGAAPLAAPRSGLSEAELPDHELSIPESPAQASTAGFKLRGAEEVALLAKDISPLESETYEAAEPGRITLKTKTMAQILAGQGEYASALEIYEELAAKAGGSDKQELLEQAALMRSKLGHNLKTAQSAASEDAEGKTKGKAKLLNMLEALAGRLEARAGA